MAIVIEEEKKSSFGMVNLLVWIFVIGALGFMLYYLFFKRPDLIPIPTPANFKDTEELSRIKLNPNSVLNSPEFRALKEKIPKTVPEKQGRANPFLGF